MRRESLRVQFVMMMMMLMMMMLLMMKHPIAGWMGVCVMH